MRIWLRKHLSVRAPDDTKAQEIAGSQITNGKRQLETQTMTAAEIAENPSGAWSLINAKEKSEALEDLRLRIYSSAIGHGSMRDGRPSATKYECSDSSKEGLTAFRPEGENENNRS